MKLKFFSGNDQAFISQKQKYLAVKSIPFVLNIRKMSLPDNLKSKQIIDNKLAQRTLLSTGPLVLIFELKK